MTPAQTHLRPPPPSAPNASILFALAMFVLAPLAWFFYSSYWLAVFGYILNAFSVLFFLGALIVGGSGLKAGRLSALVGILLSLVALVTTAVLTVSALPGLQ
jgi:hypothetical protein